MIADVMPVLERIGWDLPLFLVAFAALWFCKALYQWTESFNFSHQLTEADNPAFGGALAGYLFGATVALSAAFPRETPASVPALKEALVLLAGQAFLVALLMRASVWMVSHGVIRKFGVRYEMVEDRNVGAGAVVAGGCIASGFVLYGALSGNSDSVVLALRDVLVFWGLGQSILVGGAWLYGRVAGYDVLKALEQNNAAAGFGLAGFLVALGIVISAAVAGASSDLAAEVATTVVASAAGIVLLLITKILAARVFLPNSHMPKEIEVDRNLAAGVISAAGSVAVALLLARVISH